MSIFLKYNMQSYKPSKFTCIIILSLKSRDSISIIWMGSKEWYPATCKTAVTRSNEKNKKVRLHRHQHFQRKWLHFPFPVTNLKHKTLKFNTGVQHWLQGFCKTVTWGKKTDCARISPNALLSPSNMPNLAISHSFSFEQGHLIGWHSY